MVSQIYLDCAVCLGPENLGNKDGDSNVPLSSEDHAAPQMPVKKVTRQWAAWTRQEEESFFAALQQVGKNFEKITCHVQSKNKDQVRHYYYRLVRRMNKLLGPEFCLDAKNSKDTNAAMLRWSKKSCILHFLVEFDLLSWEMTGYGAMEFIVLLTRIQAWEASLGYI